MHTKVCGSCLLCIPDFFPDSVLISTLVGDVPRAVHGRDEGPLVRGGR